MISEAVLNDSSDIDNFSEWATEFCHNIKKQQGLYKVTCPMGEDYLHIQSDPESAEIKIFATQEPDGQDYIPSKVLHFDRYSCLYVINFLQPEGLSDGLYQQQCRAIKKEMQNIKNNFS